MPWQSATWPALVALVGAATCLQATRFAAVNPKYLKVPLITQHQSTVELSTRLAHQQVRARRRAQATTDGHFPLGTLEQSESQLGVGLGHFTALPCTPCSGCGTHMDVLFNVSKSTTAKYVACHDVDACRSCENNRCVISQNYVEGSMWQAEMVEELVWVGGFTSSCDSIEVFLKTFGFRFPLGCQIKETGLFVTQKENGIMGLGRHHATIMSYMLQAGRVTRNVFTLCFALDGGELVLGGVDYSHHTSDVGYTPLLDDKSAYYSVHVKDLRLNGKSLGIDASTLNSGKGVIVDSGTTDTFFDAQGNRQFMRAFERVAGRAYSEKHMVLTMEELAALPTISIILSGMQGNGTDDVQLDIPASRYLTPANERGAYYGNFHFSERSGGVLGASAMVGFNVIFDTDDMRVGFAESNCVRSSPLVPPTKTPLISNLTNQSVGPTALDGVVPQPISHSASSASGSKGTFTGLNATLAVDNGVDPSGATSLAPAITTSAKVGTFMVEVLLLLLVGVALAGLLWTKWRARSWSRIPDVIEAMRPEDTGSLLPST